MLLKQFQNSSNTMDNDNKFFNYSTNTNTNTEFVGGFASNEPFEKAVVGFNGIDRFSKQKASYIKTNYCLFKRFITSKSSYKLCICICISRVIKVIITIIHRITWTCFFNSITNSINITSRFCTNIFISNYPY